MTDPAFRFGAEISIGRVYLLREPRFSRSRISRFFIEIPNARFESSDAIDREDARLRVSLTRAAVSRGSRAKCVAGETQGRCEVALASLIKSLLE